MDTHYWPAELDQSGNPTLIARLRKENNSEEGDPDLRLAAHDASHAAYLINVLHLIARAPRKFAVAQVTLYECEPKASGMNTEAIRICILAQKIQK